MIFYCFEIYTKDTTTTKNLNLNLYNISIIIQSQSHVVFYFLDFNLIIKNYQKMS